MNKSVNTKRVWIAWEKQRRSLELSKVFNCSLYIFDYSGWLRYPKCCYQTLVVCLKIRPDVLFVQNPSMILAVFACFIKFFIRFKLVVDRHSSFRVGKSYVSAIDRSFFLRNLDRILNRISVGYADLTIVTNDYLAQVVEDYGGRPAILPDKIPDLSSTAAYDLKGKYNVLLISSFDLDEPFEEVFKAMSTLTDDGVCLYVTGNYKKLNSEIMDLRPDNVICTGFLSEEDFINILFSVDLVMALTTSDHTMLCSCYEAYAASQPLITSKKDVLTDYFVGARFVENIADDIAAGIVDVLSNNDSYKDKIVKSKYDIIRGWDSKLSEIEGLL